MPFQMAMAVALGRVDLNTALERLARQEKVTRLMETHDLSRALATQIVLGHADLEVVLSRRRLAEHREANRLRSCLDEAHASGEPLAFALHGKRAVTARVAAVDVYMVSLVPQSKQGDEEPIEVHKLQFKYAYQPDEWKRVKKAHKLDKVLSKDPLDPIPRPQDRYTCSDKRLFRYLDNEVPIQITLLEGDQFRGNVTWFGRYELGFKVKGDTEITVFRHCLHDISE